MDVLLVEDEAMVREMLHEDLAEAGLAVVQAATAEEGLDAVVEGARPSVLITDVNLGGGMDGVALAEEAQRRWPGICVVVMTGDERNVDRLPEALRASCLVKPFNPPRLVDAVRDKMRLVA